MVKRNNPGNIRKAAAFAWQGEQPGLSPGAYVVFDTLTNGYRAQIKLLRNYILQGKNTISKILYKWAPPSDNNPTEGYIKFVSDRTAIPADQVISATDAEKIVSIAYSMSLFEHGIRDPNNEELKAALNEAKKKFFNLIETAQETVKNNPVKSGLVVAAIAALIYFNYE